MPIRNADRDYIVPPEPDRGPRVWPWVAALLGSVVIGVILSFIGKDWSVRVTYEKTPIEPVIIEETQPITKTDKDTSQITTEELPSISNEEVSVAEGNGFNDGEMVYLRRKGDLKGGYFIVRLRPRNTNYGSAYGDK